MFWQPGSPNLEAVPDLRFACPLQMKFTFEEYLEHILHYDPWEYEHLDWLYEEYRKIQQI